MKLSHDLQKCNILIQYQTFRQSVFIPLTAPAFSGDNSRLCLCMVSGQLSTRAFPIALHVHKGEKCQRWALLSFSAAVIKPLWPVLPTQAILF